MRVRDFHGLHASDAGDATAHMLKLDRGVVNVETIGEELVDAAENAIAHRRRHVFN